MNKSYAVSISEYVQVLEARAPSKVLITVPHDGLRGFELDLYLPKRTKGTLYRDIGVWPIVRDILPVYEANVVRGLLPRGYVDYNRDASEAFEFPQFEGSYQSYHGRIFHELRQMQMHFGIDSILLFDLHGFGAQPPYAPRNGYDIILGTGNRTTVKNSEADKRLVEFLQQRGYIVFLPEQEVQHPPYDRLNGGFTVRSFAKEFGMNAIQIEIAPRFRHRNSAALGTKLSQDLAEFLLEHYAI